MTCCRFWKIKKEITCNVLGQSASAQDQASKVYWVSLKAKLRPGINGGTTLVLQVRSCSKSAYGTRLFFSTVQLPFAHSLIKTAWVFFIMNVNVLNFYNVEVLHVGSVGDLLLWKYRMFLVLHLDQECREIACLGYQAGSLSRSSPCVSIRCSAQICQAILTRVARQPANSHKHFTVFVSKSVEVREGECTEGSASLCKATTYPQQPSRDGGGSPASLVLSFAALNDYLSVAAS